MRPAGHSPLMGMCSFPASTRPSPGLTFSSMYFSSESDSPFKRAQASASSADWAKSRQKSEFEAIVAAPRVLLFDEPLSNLDSELRESLCGEMSRLLRQLGITALYVTHDRREAELLADQIVYLSAGRVAAVRAVTPTSGEVA